LTELGRTTLPFRIDMRFVVDPGRIDSAQLAPLTHDLDRLATIFVSSSAAERQGVPVLRTGLPALLRGYLAERSASQAVLSVAAIGPIVLAAGAVGMVGILLVSRRRPSLALARGRGATGLLLIGAQLWEALLLAGGATLLGLLLAFLMVPGDETSASVLLALLVAAATVGALLVATWPAAQRPLRELSETETQAAVRPSARRLVLEGTAVLLAVGGIFLLRQRGLSFEGGQEVRFDPLLAATPVLAGLAVGIVAMRLYPLPIRGLGWLAAGRRDLVPVLGLRTVGRHPATANLPLLVLMLTAAFAAFSSVVTTTVDRGQLTASWDNLGADYRIERVAGGPVTDAVDPTVVDGVQAVSAGLLEPTAGFRGAPGLAPRGSILVYALQPAAYDQVVAGSPVDPAWPVEMLAEPGQPGEVGTPDSPIPVIMSRRLPTASEPISPGDVFSVIIDGREISLVDVQERDHFAGLDSQGPFVIAPFDHLRAAYSGAPLQPTLLMVRGPADIGERLADTVRQQLPAARVTSRHDAYQELQDAPLVASVITGFRVALLAAAAYTALAILASLTLSAARRTRDLAFLRTLGLSSGQALGLTVMEHAPPVLIAVIPGVVLGVGVAYLLGPTLGLSAFAGTDAALDLTVDWASVALLSGMLIGVVALAIALSTWISRRTQAMDALRIGDD
jgi:putative ABC transport system permease protein